MVPQSGARTTPKAATNRAKSLQSCQRPRRQMLKLSAKTADRLGWRSSDTGRGYDESLGSSPARQQALLLCPTCWASQVRSPGLKICMFCFKLAAQCPSTFPHASSVSERSRLSPSAQIPLTACACSCFKKGDSRRARLMSSANMRQGHWCHGINNLASKQAPGSIAHVRLVFKSKVQRRRSANILCERRAGVGYMGMGLSLNCQHSGWTVRGRAGLFLPTGRRALLLVRTPRMY